MIRVTLFSHFDITRILNISSKIIFFSDLVPGILFDFANVTSEMDFLLI